MEHLVLERLHRVGVAVLAKVPQRDLDQPPAVGDASGEAAQQRIELDRGSRAGRSASNLVAVDRRGSARARRSSAARRRPHRPWVVQDDRLATGGKSRPRARSLGRLKLPPVVLDSTSASASDRSTRSSTSVARWPATSPPACSASSTRTPPSRSSAPCCAPTASTAPTPRACRWSTPASIAASQPAASARGVACCARPRARARRRQRRKRRPRRSPTAASSTTASGGPTPRGDRGARSRRTPPPALDAHRSRARQARAAIARASAPGPTPWKYVIVATGNIYDDADQARAAAQAGADIIAVIRSTAQSLIDYVPYGATTEGFGGTWATQENFKIVRAALDDEQEKLGRYLQQVNYSSGLCMPEIAYLGAVERLDMLLNDAMYGILFRDINPRRTLCDQYFSRRVIARAGIIINTGEDNYLTTADAVEKAHTVLSSQFINEAFAHARRPARRADGARPRLRDRQVDRGLVPDGDRAGAAGAADLPAPSDQVDAGDQAQVGRHLLVASRRRAVRSGRASPPSSRSSCSA